ncbi:hypothetical protein BDN72DRAFT_837495 [Pluteus cervinus]|uniref:Uncharacterized protein n=1 Tax=Pluteus cervinus TaxID=181527 RepID=A0ACD3B148_9AGAR|nr:hypothetical protein BDN72DRAFT_837495 [Pluteus cervinus]
MDSFATELLERILSWACVQTPPIELSQTLRNCCLVCSRWRQIAQPLLLSEFALYGREYDREALSDALLRFPELQNHVKSLWISPGVWLDEAENQAALNHILPNLGTIVILASNGSIWHPHIDTLSAMFSSDRLTRLVLRGLQDMLVSIFSCCTSLSELYLHDCQFTFHDTPNSLRVSNTGSGESPRRRERPKLTGLYLDSALELNVEVLTWFMSPECVFDLSQLSIFHQLESPEDSVMFELYQSFVNFVSPSLSELALYPHHEFGSINILDNPEVASSTQFGSLPNLRVLQLSTVYDNNWVVPPVVHLPWATTLISNLSHPQNLQSLRLPFSFYHWPVYDHSKPRSNPDDAYFLNPTWRRTYGWEDFDEMLTSNRFVSLRSVHFGVLCSGSLPEMDRALARQLVALFPRLFPKLHERGVLGVTYTKEGGFMLDGDAWYRLTRRDRYY